MTSLEKIVNNRRALLIREKQSVPEKEIRKKTEDLYESGYVPDNFLNTFNYNKPFLIAEIKKSSPSKGIIRNDFNINEIAGAYKSFGYVNSISVLTEPDFFSGRYEYIKTTRETAKKPVLMKDFVIDEYQIYRGFLEGASAVLLIAAVLDEKEITKLAGLARELNMKILFETHTVTEYRTALNNDFDLIGINNRDLKTFVTDIYTTIKIFESEGKPQNRIVITESGIESREDVRLLRDNGADGFLIGERFMKQKDIAAAISDLFGESNASSR